MAVYMALWDRCTAAGASVLHPSHDSSRSLFAGAMPVPGNEAGFATYLFLPSLLEIFLSYTWLEAGNSCARVMMIF